VRVSYRGESRELDLHAEDVEDVKLGFADGITIQRGRDGGASMAGQMAGGRSSPHTALPDAVYALRASGPLDTLFLSLEEDDFEDWPAPDLMGPRHLSLRRIGGAAATLSDLLPEALAYLGTKRLILSSRLAPEPCLLSALAAIPSLESVVLGLAAIPAADDRGGPLPVERVFADHAGWLGALGRQRLRDQLAITVAGTQIGSLAVYEAAGLKPHRLPAPLARPGLVGPRYGPEAPGHGDGDSGIDVALCPAGSLGMNLMHMLGAAVIARARGLPIARLWLPEAFEQRFQQGGDVLPGLELHWYRTLEMIDREGRPGIAVAAAPDAIWPIALTRALVAGWLPLAGATEALDAMPTLAATHTVAHWEDAGHLADALEALAAEHDAALDRFQAVAVATEAAGRRALEALLTKVTLDQEGRA
ncbi:MAG: hypothetical protein AAGF76_13920, partial [Pseudomonadota bacterium]